MASQLNLRRASGGPRTAARPRWAVLVRVVLAVALALLTLPLLGSGASAAGGGATSGGNAAATVTGVPGVCDTNQGTGKIDSFMQNTEPDGSGVWANGNMNDAKADLVEGDVVPQRVEMSGLKPGENELAFTYDVYVMDKDVKKWAYDYITKYSMTGGATITRWYVENGDGPTAKVYVTFDVPAGVTTATLYYDLHIASELDHGAGSGAGSINGSPYHGGLVSLNCAASGANANQIMASAIDAGLLTVVKDATPADGTDFHFSITPGGDASTFALDDDGDATLPDRLTYRVPPGTYTAEEVDLPAGWNLTGIVCSKAASGSTPTSRSVAIADDESVTCTFSNSKISRRDLTVTATANPSYDRDYDWKVDKSVVGAPTKKIADGQSADFDYSVVVTPSAPKDSNFEVSGQISVANPNDIAIDGVRIDDSIPGATCTVYDGGNQVTGPVTIPAGGKSFTYSCAMGAGTRADTTGTNTVSLSWSASDYYGTSGTATGTRSFDFATAKPALTDDSVTVTDSSYDLGGYPGGNVVQATGGARTFTYPLTWPGEPGACKTYDNTATITEPDNGTSSDGARVEVCEGKDLTVSKTVVHSYYRTYDWSLSKAVVGDATKDVGPGGTATFDYKVTATGGKATDSRWAMSGDIKVSNPNSWAVTLSDVTDQVDVGGGATCAVDKGSDLVVAANSDRTFEYTCTFTSKPSYDGTNTATATWVGTNLVSPNTSATGTAAVTAGRWDEASVDKTVTVVDDKTDPANPVTLGTATWAGEGVTKEFTYTGPALAGRKGECVDYTNNAWIEELPAKTASAKVTVCEPADVSVSKDVDATYDTTYFWDVSKDVDKSYAEVGPGGTARFDYTVVAKPNGSVDSGWDMGGTITVSNPNTFKSVTVALSDVYDGGGVCTPESASVVVPAATESGGVVVPASVRVPYGCSFPGGEPAYSGTNTVTASWEGQQVSATAPVRFRRVGQTDYRVPVYDDLTNPAGTAKQLGTAVWDAPLADRTFQNSLDLGAAAGQCVDYTNTAWVDVTGLDLALIAGVVAEAADPSAQQTVEVCEPADVSVSKDVDATYDTTYFWDVSKDVDKSYAEVGPGGTARFDYTVVAKPNGSVDSGWDMGGTITVSNPNTFKSVTVALSDVYDGGGVCTPESASVVVPAATESGGVVVPASVRVPYGCSFPGGEPAYSGTNTVTASWEGQQVSATAPVRFRRVGQTDYRVPVYDDLTNPAGTAKQLGTAVWDAPLADRTFQNSLDLGAAAGQCVDYTNTAWVDVTAGDIGVIIPQATVQATNPSAQQTVEVCEKAGLTVVKDAKATYDTTYLWDLEKTVSPERAEIPAGEKQDFEYAVTAVPNGYVDSGWDLTGTITVSNPNAFESVDATLADSYDNGTADPADDVACAVTYPNGLDHLVVPKGTTSGSTVTPGTASATYDCDFVSKPAYSGQNHVTVTWGGGESESFVKDVSFEQDKTTDKTVTVYDDKIDLDTPVALGEATWAWDEETDKPVSTVFPKYTLTRGGTAGECTDYTNTAWIDVTRPRAADPEASATSTLCVEQPLGITKTVRASFDRGYHWLIDKSVDDSSVEVTHDGDATFDYTVEATPDGYLDSGYRMGGAITVTNPNTYTGGAITTTVTDVPDVGGGATCVVPGGDSVTLEPGESRTLDYTCSFTSAPGSSGTNTATATWTGPDTKSHSSSTGAVPVSFRLDGMTNQTVTVTDSMTDPSELGTATWNEDGTPTKFTYSLKHEGKQNRCVDYTNTARIVETQQSDSQTVTVCDQGDLVVTKTATASYDRTYEWDITKVADRARLDTAAGETGKVDYTVGVTPKGFVDSDWEMSGEVTVYNPNDYKDVTVDLTEDPDLGGGATCDFDETDDLVVEAGETRSFRYTCSFTEEPSYDGSNTVEVDWDGGHVSATTEVDFSMDEEVDKTVTVTDDLLDPSELGEVTWDEDGETVEFEYAMEFEGQADECNTVTNTATIVETGQDAQADVEVCGSEILPAEGESAPPSKPGPPIKPEVPVKPRPPAEILPETGAPGGTGIWTTLGGLMVAVGAALLIRRRRDAS